MVGRPRTGAGIALGIAVLLVLAAGALAKPGQVDTRYGFNGSLDITGALPGPEFQRGALATAVGPQDESVVLSYATRPCAGPGTCADLHVTRVLADGSLDSAYGARGGVVASVDWGSGGWAVGPNGGIAVQADGKVVVAAGDGFSVRVARLNPDGSNDTVSSIPLGDPVTVTDLAIRPTGEIVVSGASGDTFFVSQLTADGGSDSRFGARGTRFESFQPGALPGDLVLRGASTVVGGNACCAPSSSMALAEFDAAGNLSGAIRVRLPKRLGLGKPKGIAAVIPGPKGSTFVVGSAAKGTFVAKYLRSGRLETDFGKGGFAVVRGLTTEARSAVRDSRGRIVVLGWRLDVPDSAGFRARFVSTVRLLPSGRPDPTYGGVRPLLVVEEGGLRVGLDFSRSIGLVQRSDGLLMMLGEADPNRYAKVPSGPHFGLVRFLAGGRLRR